MSLETTSRSRQHVWLARLPLSRDRFAPRDACDVEAQALEASVGKGVAKLGMGAAMQGKWLSKAKGADGQPILTVPRHSPACRTYVGKENASRRSGLSSAMY